MRLMVTCKSHFTSQYLFSQTIKLKQKKNLRSNETFIFYTKEFSLGHTNDMLKTLLYLRELLQIKGHQDFYLCSFLLIFNNPEMEN